MGARILTMPFISEANKVDNDDVFIKKVEHTLAILKACGIAPPSKKQPKDVFECANSFAQLIQTKGIDIFIATIDCVILHYSNLLIEQGCDNSIGIEGIGTLRELRDTLIKTA